MRLRGCLSPSLSLVRGILASPYQDFLVGRLLAYSLLRLLPGTPEVQPHIWDLSWLRARARARMVAAVRFVRNRNN